MAQKNLIAEVQTTIEAPIDKVWAAIVDPATIKEYMFGTTVPANYHTVTIELTVKDEQTIVSLSQDNNATQQEKEHSEHNWMMMLTGLKNLLDNSAIYYQRQKPKTT